MTKSSVFYGAGARFLSRTTAACDRRGAPDVSRTRVWPRTMVSQDRVSRDTVYQAARVRAG